MSEEKKDTRATVVAAERTTAGTVKAAKWGFAGVVIASIIIFVRPWFWNQTPDQIQPEEIQEITSDPKPEEPPTESLGLDQPTSLDPIRPNPSSTRLDQLENLRAEVNRRLDSIRNTKGVVEVSDWNEFRSRCDGIISESQLKEIDSLDLYQSDFHGRMQHLIQTLNKEINKERSS